MREEARRGESSIYLGVLLSVVVLACAFAMILVVYGVESIAPGVHDAYHDFRHTIGMPCH